MTTFSQSIETISGAVRARMVPAPGSTLERKFFEALCALAGALCVFVLFPLHWIRHSNDLLTGCVLGFGGISFLLAFASRRGREFRTVWLVCLVVSLDLIWFANGGSQGSTALYFSGAALLAVLLYQGRSRFLALVALLTNLIVLNGAEHVLPHTVHAFGSNFEQTTDRIVGYVLSNASCGLILWIVLKGFREEMQRQGVATRALVESEKRFGQVFENSPDGLLILDQAKRTVLEVNSGFERMFELSREKCLTQSIHELPIWGDQAGRDWGKTKSLDHPAYRELPLRRMNCTMLWGDVMAAPLNISGRECLLVTFRDVTERHRANQALSESEQLYRDLLEQQGEGLAVTDPDERFVFANAVAEQVFGVAPGALVGTSLLDYLDDEERQKVELQSEQRARNERSTYQLQIRRPSGERRMILVTATCERMRRRAPAHSIGVFRDITEQLQAEDARVQLDRERNHSQRLDSLGTLAGGVAHDFNNMLSGILGYAELLLLDEKHPLRRGHLEAIVLAATRSADLTRNLLAFGRRGKNLTESLDLPCVLRECLDMLRPSTSADLKVELQLESCPQVEGDPGQIHQVFMNLLINAMEAMTSTGTLKVSTRLLEQMEPAPMGHDLPEGRYVEICVSDTGQGMTEEVLQRIFEPFFTTKSEKRTAGTGLGLSTAYGIVRAHKGALFAETRLGAGSTFHVLLPAGAKAGTTTKKLDQVARAQGRILLVEDEAILRNLGTAMLQELGYEAVTAEDGMDAIQVFQAQQQQFQAVVLDLRMPRMDGRDCFLEIRKLNASIPVLVCTGYGENNEVQEMLSLGAAGWMPKPFSLAKLSTELERILRGSSTGQEPS